MVLTGTGWILGNHQVGVLPTRGANREFSPGVLGEEGEDAGGSRPAPEEGAQADDPFGKFLMSFPFIQRRGLSLPRLVLEEELIRCKGNYSLGCVRWVALEPPGVGVDSPLVMPLQSTRIQ